MKTLKYLFWRLYYLVTPKPRGFPGVLLMYLRCRSPWWKFKPFVTHNDEGRQWEVCFIDESSYSEEQTPVLLSVQRSMDTGKVTGFTVYDHVLANLARKP